jgi:hemerythrin-like domain-containing protein
MPDGHTPKQMPPLKRHAALQPLSREHMSGLIQARNLNRAANADAGARRAALAAFTEVWRNEIREHFDDEERLLLPLTQEPALRDRLLEEHRAIRELARRCEEDPGAVAEEPPLMRRIGSLLHDHIRWEEREYFEAIQRDHPDALAALEHEADRIEQRRPGARARRTLE